MSLASSRNGDPNTVKRIPEPTIALTPPAYEISDHTAAIKAGRLMGEMKEYGAADRWFRDCAAIRLKPDASNTRRWRAILQIPKVRDDIYRIWLNRKDRLMDKPDPKKTAEVAMMTLVSDSTSANKQQESRKELYLAVFSFIRGDFLRKHGPDVMREIEYFALLSAPGPRIGVARAHKMTCIQLSVVSDAFQPTMRAGVTRTRRHYTQSNSSPLEIYRMPDCQNSEDESSICEYQTTKVERFRETSAAHCFTVIL